MDRVRPTPVRAVIEVRLTACARHSSKDLAALQQVVLGLVDLCRVSVSKRPHSRLSCTGTILLPYSRAARFWHRARGKGRSRGVSGAARLLTKIDCDIPSNCAKKAFDSFSRGSAAELVAIARVRRRLARA